LGVTDVDGDGRLDLFTVNHSSPQSVLLNAGDGAFEEAFERMGLYQDAGFPGLASTERPPELTESGLYVYWAGPELILQTHDLNRDVAGSIVLDSSVEITGQNGAEVSVEQNVRSEHDQSSLVSFRLSGRGLLSLRPEIHALPMELDIEDLRPEQIFVGFPATSPQSERFVLFLKDRHGMVWFDYDSDGANDLFITRGGQSGLMRYKETPFWDEFFHHAHDGYEPAAAAELGFAKEGCPGRQAAAVDFDGDGLLDIYVACGRTDETHPNKLFRRVDQTSFEDVAPELGLDIGDDGSFVWLDVDVDGDMDLFWDGKTGLGLYRNEGGRFAREPLELRARNWTKHLSVADYDNDGDLDIFSSCTCGNLMFENDGGRLVRRDPAALGLPPESQTAGWVDFDNDGDMDLHAIPDGLFEQSQAHRFVATGLFRESRGRFDLRRTTFSVANWFDFDNNGSRDVAYVLEKTRATRRLADWIAAAKRVVGIETPQRIWDVLLLKNERTANNWLQVDLVGAKGNRNAIGARVEIEYGPVKQVQHVGSAEGSHFSQGHYRLYFGLGQAGKLDSLRVIWPDGSTSEVDAPDINRVLEISKE
jgi:hypothetical protein